MDYGKKRTLEKQRKVCDELLEIKTIRTIFLFQRCSTQFEIYGTKTTKTFLSLFFSCHQCYCFDKKEENNMTQFLLQWILSQTRYELRVVVCGSGQLNRKKRFLKYVLGTDGFTITYKIPNNRNFYFEIIHVYYFIENNFFNGTRKVKE